MSAVAPGTRRSWAGLLLALAPLMATAAGTQPPAAQPGAPAALFAEVRDSGEAGTPETSPEVAEQVVRLGDALRAGELEAARAQLALLQAQLPIRSLTLLRMQAWYAHVAGDSARAISLYRDIVARLPGDATAAINLAILEAGNGQPDSARQRLRRLRALDTGSQQIERTISQVEAQLK